MKEQEKVEKIALRISPEEKRALAAIAQKEDLSLSQVVRKACREFLDRYNAKE